MGKTFKKIDKVLLVLTILFCVLGLLMIFSASSVSTVLRYKVPEYYFFSRQVVSNTVRTIFVINNRFIIWFIYIWIREGQCTELV